MNRCLSKHEVQIPGFGSINLNVGEADVNTSDYFLMAVRKNNLKRNFLFVSKLLGKHIPIDPNILFDSCYELSSRYALKNSLSKESDGTYFCAKKTLVIGFAETATAMGHAIYDSFSGNCSYVHTTRERVSSYEFAFEFEEEHCHAVEQLFFLQKEDWIKDAEEILIVDDELTTGKTIRNIIGQIEKVYPGKSYSVLTFLDWRNEENLSAYEAYQKANRINIEVYSFVSGNIESIAVSDNTVEEIDEVLQPDYNLEEKGWKIHHCGIDSQVLTSATSGIDIQQREAIKRIAEQINTLVSPHLSGTKRAVIGTGEFMYLPMLCAQQFPGDNYCNATTRSPIIANNHADYGVKKAFSFICPTDQKRTEYLYNSNVLACDEVIVFFERAVPAKQLSGLLSSLDTAGYHSKHVVFVK